MGDLAFPDVNWEYHTADTNGSRKFLKHIEDNLLMHVLRKGALLDLLFVYREGLMAEEVVGGCLGCSDHKVVEFRVICNSKKS